MGDSVGGKVKASRKTVLTGEKEENRVGGVRGEVHRPSGQLGSGTRRGLGGQWVKCTTVCHQQGQWAQELKPQRRLVVEAEAKAAAVAAAGVRPHMSLGPYSRSLGLTVAVEVQPYQPSDLR